MMLKYFKQLIQRQFGGGWVGTNLENPNVPLSVGADDLFGGRKTSSGTRVAHQTALRIPAFWQGVNKISGDVAKVPMELYRRIDSRDREKATSHPAYHLVRYQANDEQTARQWKRQQTANALIWGNAYSWLDRDERGIVRGIYPLLPDRTRCIRIDGRKVYETEIDGRLQYYDAFDVFHLKGLSLDGETGLDLIYYMRNAIGKILARENFASRFYARGGRVGGILQLPWIQEKTRRDKIEANFRQTYETEDAAFKTVVLRENAKFHAAQANFRDTQMLETAKEDVRTVARMLNMPPHKLGDDSKSSHSSLESENKSYNNDTLSHWFMEFEDECFLKLLDRQTRQRHDHFFEHTIGALLWADSKTVSEIGSRGVLAGWLRPNEPRNWFNLPADPDGDKLLIPSGMVLAEDIDGEPDDENRSAINELKESVAQRFEKRLQTQIKKHQRSNTLDQWDADSNLAIGRDMFAQVQRLEQSLFGQTEDYANQIIQRIKNNE